MVITGHFIDSDWKLQTRVLNFFHLPPPHRGTEIADAIHKCTKEWGIVNKIFSISVDNASCNDKAIQRLKDDFSTSRKLVCGGKLFHVRCCAHILNLMVQDGLGEIKDIIANVRESVNYLNQSEARLCIFSEIVQQLQLPARKMITDCKTRWNSTYEMLSCALKFKTVFPRFKESDDNYKYCPSTEDWIKVEQICEILEVFADATNIISGSDYPTSNLFLNEVYRVKLLLDDKIKNENAFIRSMVVKMKSKFDKYWGECNLLMAIAAILDPRCKMRVIEFWFPKVFPADEVEKKISGVKDTLRQVFTEYVAMQDALCGEPSDCLSTTTYATDVRSSSSKGWSEFQKFVRSIETIQPQKSDLETYLEEGCYIADTSVANSFDVLGWWKANELKYRILAKMAADILAIPISTVASEATFSAGSRVIDTYRASLAPDTVQALLCGGDWLRNLHGIKKKSIGRDKKPTVIKLPIT